MTNEPQKLSTPPSWIRELHLFGEAGMDILSHDWSVTDLASIENWPAALAALVQSTLASPFAAALALGPRHRLIYNAQASRLLRRSGPIAAGSDAVATFSRSWLAAPQAFERAFAGELVRADRQAFHGADGEPVIADVSLAPLHGVDGLLACVQAQIVEKPKYRNHIADGGGLDLDGIPVVACRVAADGAWVTASPRWAAHTGLSQRESEGFGWLQAVHPDDRALTRASWSEAQGRGGFECDHRIYDRRRNLYGWRRTCARRRGVDDAGIAEWLATSIDIDDLWTKKEEQAAALAESRRRIRNTLGIVRSIARRTAETSDSVESCAMHFEGRLDALARVGSLVAGSQSSGVPLDALIAEELFSFKAREDSGLQISGRPVRVKPEAAEMLGLAIHELATNAMKFGALSLAGGRLEISWRLIEREPNVLLLSWIESGVAVSRDLQQANGFGGDLLKRGLAYALNARTQFVLQADGLSCSIELPATIFVA